MYLTIFFPAFFTDCIMSILLRGGVLHTPTACVCVLWWCEWAALSWPQAPLTRVVAFPSLSRRRVCHLLPPGCQHVPRPLRPHALLQLLCLEGLQGHGQMPRLSLGDRGGGPGWGSSCPGCWRGPPGVGAEL